MIYTETFHFNFPEKFRAKFELSFFEQIENVSIPLEISGVSVSLRGLHRSKIQWRRVGGRRVSRIILVVAEAWANDLSFLDGLDFYEIRVTGNIREEIITGDREG